MRLVISALVLSAAIAAAQAQDYKQPPTYGDISLSRGFAPDPHKVVVKSGGKADAGQLGGGCTGHIANAPDVQLTLESGDGALYIGVDSQEDDTSLVINTPSGDWVCDDDSGGNLSPLVTFERAESGVYDIWVGASGAQEHTATLMISSSGPPVAETPVAQAAPAQASAATAALTEDEFMEEHWKAYLADIQSRGLYQNWSGPPRDLYDSRTAAGILQ
jgi:hypothetical protein